MKINTEYAEIKETQSEAVAINAKLCFENLRCADYKEGYLVTESNLAQEKKGSPLCELAAFSNIMVDKCNTNESDNTSSIYVSAIVNGKDNLQSLYEWIEKYAGKDKVDAIAPGLLEALKQEPEAEKVDEDNSVATRFAKYRKLYEDNSADEEKPVNEEDSVSEEDTVSEGDDDDKKDDEGEKSDDDKKDDEDEKSDDEDEEQDELTAVVLEVKKGDEDKLKDELIEAGVDEDDIEIITEDEDKEDKEDESEEKNEDKDEKGGDEDKDETVKVKIAVDSFDALKEYLEGKGFNLEEELGGEIVSDDSEDSEGDDEDDKKDQEELDAEFDGFDDLFK